MQLIVLVKLFVKLFIWFGSSFIIFPKKLSEFILSEFADIKSTGKITSVEVHTTFVSSSIAVSSR